MVKSIAVDLPINGDMLGIWTNFWLYVFMGLCPDPFRPAASAGRRFQSLCEAR